MRARVLIFSDPLFPSSFVVVVLDARKIVEVKKSVLTWRGITWIHTRGGSLVATERCLLERGATHSGSTTAFDDDCYVDGSYG